MNSPFEHFPYSRGPVEPGGDVRSSATAMFQQYAAYLQAGFTPGQAMDLLTTALAAVIAAQHRGGTDK